MAAHPHNETARGRPGPKSAHRQLVTTFAPARNTFATKHLDLNLGHVRRQDDPGHPNGARHSISQHIGQTLATGPKTHCSLAFLLAANLLMSVLNTLLLSFIVKSVQLSGHGFFNGKLTWHQHSATTLLSLPTSLPMDKSILLQSIESHADRPLVVQHWPYASAVSSLAGQQFTGTPDLIIDDKRPTKARPLLISATRFSPQPNLSNEERDGSKSNYIAVNANDDKPNSTHDKRPPVEIATSSLVFSLINNGEPARTGGSDKAQPDRAGASGHQPKGANNTRITIGNKGRTSINPIRRLLEFDGERQSITLPLLSHLDLGTSSSGSLIVNKDLNLGPEVTGTIEENLDLQTRGANLTCKSVGALRLVSKSAELHMVAGDTLIISAPVISLDESLLLNKSLIFDGIEYFDLEPNHASDVSLKMVTNERQSMEIEPEEVLNNLRAYNLVLVDGVLMATA